MMLRFVEFQFIWIPIFYHFLFYYYIIQIFLDQLSRLHMILKPFMLRRIKKDVENELSEKIEIKVICQMSTRQKLFYQAVKNQIMFEDLLQSTTTNSEKSTSLLMNLVMQFRKVLTCPNIQLYYLRKQN